MLRDFTQEKFDIIIQAGQSNAQGIGEGLAKEPYVPDEKVLYLNRDFTISTACETVEGNEIRANFSLTFARAYINAGMLETGRKILVLRAAVGGTGFSDKRWGMEDDLYLKMMEMIRTTLSMNPENRLVALLWHQGETDATHKATYEGHYANLMNLVNSVKTTFDVENLPFIAGDFVQDWKSANLEICTPVVDAIRAVCRDISRGGFVETDGLLSNAQAMPDNPRSQNDTIHFTREAIYELGIRYFDCFTSIISA